MKYTLFSLTFITLIFTTCQSPTRAPSEAGAAAETAEVAEPTPSDVTIRPILHGSLALEWEGRMIFIDPYGGAERYTELGAPDLILITHPHGDHLNPETLQGLQLGEAELIAPQAVVDELGDISFGKVAVLGNGEEIQTHGLTVRAVPMYNLPETEDSRHKKGWGNGYVLTLGGERFYISGDTEDIPEMRQLENIDVAFVCMNLPYTMTVEQAADAVLEFKPEVVYPYHYRGSEGLSDVGRFKELVEAGGTETEVRLAEWYPEE